MKFRNTKIHKLLKHTFANFVFPIYRTWKTKVTDLKMLFHRYTSFNVELRGTEIYVKEASKLAAFRNYTFDLDKWHRFSSHRSSRKKRKYLSVPRFFLYVNAWKRVEGFRRFHEEACTCARSFMLLLSIHHAGTRTRTWHTSVVSWSRCKKWVIFWELNFSEADSGRTKKITDEFDPPGILWLSWNRSRLRRSLKLKASCSQNQVDRLPWFFLLVDERASPAKNRFSLLDPSIPTSVCFLTSTEIWQIHPV